VQSRSSNTEFARVYEDHVWRVYGFIAYRLADPHAAEDLTQATFERALRAWSRFDRRRASERTWLLAIAHNVLVDHHRRRRPAVVEAIDEHALASVPGPEARMGGAPEILAALATLSERDREVLALRYGGDLTGPEIGQLLDLSLANVHQIISRSLRTLRGLLEQEPGRIRA
jgi:RNA polymerase sigma factor (sigma-70 family)